MLLLIIFVFIFFFKFVIFLYRVCKPSRMGLQPLVGSADPRLGRKNPSVLSRVGLQPPGGSADPRHGRKYLGRRVCTSLPVLHTQVQGSAAQVGGSTAPKVRVCKLQAGLQTQTRGFINPLTWVSSHALRFCSPLMLVYTHRPGM